MCPRATAARALVATVASLTRPLSQRGRPTADYACTAADRARPRGDHGDVVCTGMGGELTGRRRRLPGAALWTWATARLAYVRRRMQNWDAPSAPAVVVNFAVGDLSYTVNGCPMARVTASMVVTEQADKALPGDADLRRDEFRLSTVLVGGRLLAGSSRRATCARGTRSWRTPSADDLSGAGTWSTRRPGTRGWCAPSMPPDVHAGARRRGPAPLRAHRRRARPGVRARSIRASTAGALGNRDAQREYRVYAAAHQAVAVLAQDDYHRRRRRPARRPRHEERRRRRHVDLPAPATITALEVFEQGGRGVVGARGRRTPGRRRGDHGPRVPAEATPPGAPSPRRRRRPRRPRAGRLRRRRPQVVQDKYQTTSVVDQKEAGLASRCRC